MLRLHRWKSCLRAFCWMWNSYVWELQYLISGPAASRPARNDDPTAQTGLENCEYHWSVSLWKKAATKRKVAVKHISCIFPRPQGKYCPNGRHTHEATATIAEGSPPDVQLLDGTYSSLRFHRTFDTMQHYMGECRCSMLREGCRNQWPTEPILHTIPAQGSNLDTIIPWQEISCPIIQLWTLGHLLSHRKKWVQSYYRTTKSWIQHTINQNPAHFNGCLVFLC